MIPAPQTHFLLAVALGSIAAAANLLGGYFVVRKDWSRRYLEYFLALGAGYLLAVAFLEIIPESVRLGGDTAMLFVLAGYFLVHLFEHTLAPHFHFGEETHHEEISRRHAGMAALFGLLIHTFFDGVAIAAGFLVSARLGVLIFVAVVLHKLPEGFTVASLMLASGQSRRAAFYATALLGAATLAGVILTGFFPGRVGFALPLAGGVAVYVAASDLIPEVNRQHGWHVAPLVFLGAAILLALSHLFHF